MIPLKPTEIPSCETAGTIKNWASWHGWSWLLPSLCLISLHHTLGYSQKYSKITFNTFTHSVMYRLYCLGPCPEKCRTSGVATNGVATGEVATKTAKRWLFANGRCPKWLKITEELNPWFFVWSNFERFIHWIAKPSKTAKDKILQEKSVYL